MSSEKASKKDDKEIKRDIKIACEVIMVVFSMCLVTFLMFFATYKEKEAPNNDEIEENVEAFMESDFYQIISYEI